MQSASPSPTVHFPVDDCDLDDAELWAVIDSAAATARARKPALLSTPSSSHRNARHRPTESFDGEVVQQENPHWPHRRPAKMPRMANAEASGTHDHRMIVVRQQNAPRTPTPVAVGVYSSPDQRRLAVAEICPVVESPPPTFESTWNEEKGSIGSSLPARMPSPSLFRHYQNAAMEILEKGDFTMISGSPFIKKSGWRKIAFFFNISFEIKDKSIEFDENRNVHRAEFVVRASMQGGRFSDGWGSCDRREKRFQKANHDVPSTAETRAKNKACQDLLGIGEYQSVKSLNTGFH